MRRSLTRRRFIGAAAIASSTVGLQYATAQTPIPGATTDASLGDPKQAFDALFEGSHEEGAFSVYDLSAEGKAVYWVNWDENGRSQLIEIDFSALPNNGYEYSNETAG